MQVTQATWNDDSPLRIVGHERPLPPPAPWVLFSTTGQACDHQAPLLISNTCWLCMTRPIPILLMPHVLLVMLLILRERLYNPHSLTSSRGCQKSLVPLLFWSEWSTQCGVPDFFIHLHCILFKMCVNVLEMQFYRDGMSVSADWLMHSADIVEETGHTDKGEAVSFTSSDGHLFFCLVGLLLH